MTKDAATSSSKRLGRLLLDGHLITEGQLREALIQRQEEGGFLGRILVDLGYLKEHDLINLLVKQCKIPHISLTDYAINQDLVNLISRETCVEHQCVPVDKMGSILTVAMVDPLDTDALAAIRAACPELRIKPILCTWRHYEQVMMRLFPGVREAKPASETSLDDFGLSTKPQAAKKTAPQPEPLEELVTAVAAGDEAPPEGFEEFLQLEVKRAINAAVDQVGQSIRDRIRRQGTGKPLSAPLFTQSVRWAFRDATEEAVGTLLYVTQTAIDRARKKGSDLSGDELTELLRDAFRLGFQDALEALARDLTQEK